MTDNQIYTIIAEVTGLEKEYLMLGRSVQLVRPWEVAAILRKAMAEVVHGKVCPRCSSFNIEAEDAEFEALCNGCGNIWGE